MPPNQLIYEAFFKSALLTLIVSLCCTPSVMSQTNFKLNKKYGHYFLITTVNGNPDTEILVESGIPGILINENNFGRLFNESDFEKIHSDKTEISFDNISYPLKKVLKGKVSFGDTSFDGNIYIIDNYEKICVPIHRLKNEADPAADLIRLNFKDKALDFVNRSDVNTNKMNQYTLVEYTPMPIFESKLEMADTYNHNAEISGKFIFDLGNGSPLFLFRKNIAPFIKGNKFKVLPAKDKSTGDVIGQGIYAAYCKIGKRSLRDISVGITNRVWRSDSILGCVGPTFFKGSVILDPVNKIIFYE